APHGTQDASEVQRSTQSPGRRQAVADTHPGQTSPPTRTPQGVRRTDNQAMTDTSFLEHLAAARSDAEFARTAAGFAILQIYDSVKTNGLSASILGERGTDPRGKKGDLHFTSHVRTGAR